MKFKELLKESMPKTLYHGTLRQFVPSIMQIGLVPDIGEFTRQAYQEYEEAGIELPDLVFAADKDGLGSCVSAIIGALEQSKIEDTTDNFFRYGAIVVLKHGAEDFEHRDEDDDGREEHPQTVESGDYYREYSIKPDFVMMGKRLKAFLSRNKQVVERFGKGGFDKAAVRNWLISYAKKEHPETYKNYIPKVLSLDDETLRKWWKTYHRKEMYAQFD